MRGRPFSTDCIAGPPLIRSLFGWLNINLIDAIGKIITVVIVAVVCHPVSCFFTPLGFYSSSPIPLLLLLL